MESNDAIGCLSALAHPGRLEAFRMLIQAGVLGLPAGEIAQRLGTPANSLSTNLSILHNAGLVRSRRQGRSIIYTADYDQMRHLMTFLLQDCCGGAPDICQPLTDVLRQGECQPSCSPDPKKRP